MILKLILFKLIVKRIEKVFNTIIEFIYIKN